MHIQNRFQNRIKIKVEPQEKKFGEPKMVLGSTLILKFILAATLRPPLSQTGQILLRRFCEQFWRAMTFHPQRAIVLVPPDHGCLPNHSFETYFRPSGRVRATISMEELDNFPELMTLTSTKMHVLSEPSKMW